MGRVISVRNTGNFQKTDRFLSGLIGAHYMRKLKKYGERGVAALRDATPKDSGKTAESWSYEIEQTPGRTAIYWKNSHVENGVNIAVILQYGHGTRTGGFVEGTDYIRPAIRPIFEEMANEVWREVVL
jgi:hypothetical protein